MQQDPITPEESQAGAVAPTFRLFRPRLPVVALGLAVNYLMAKPAFASLQFGEWSRILVGQINRGHYYFAVDAGNHIQGFIGWALTTQEKAEDWLERRKALSYQDSRQGECVIINAWAAENRAVHRFLVDELRKIFRDKEALYFKRFYKDGSVRPSRLSVNEFVERHIERDSRSPAGEAT
jgi:hemolysin-activating ACP:hemolysin acyltransferase